MAEAPETIVNIVAPRQVAAELESSDRDGVTMERVGGEEQSLRFGIAEAIVLVGLAKGVLEVVKLALELRDRLRESGPTQLAQLSAPGAEGWVEIKASMGDDDVERKVREHFRD